MGFFKRNRQATERVQDLKNRVESLRKVDDAHRALTLDDFLAGDDAVTARSEPRSAKSAPAETSSIADENALEAELQRYLQSHVDTEELEDTDTVFAAPGFEPVPVREEPPSVRPISIDEFPPLPHTEDAFKPRQDAFEPASPPRLSADDEAALIAELQRYLKTDDVEGNEDALGDLAGFETAEEQDGSPDTAAVAVDAPENVVEFPVPERAANTSDSTMSPNEAPRIVEIDGRSYEVPKPRHWPSVPAPQPDPEGESERPARRASDWEPL
jgi:hypothetical protein